MYCRTNEGGAEGIPEKGYKIREENEESTKYTVKQMIFVKGASAHVPRSGLDEERFL
jgi:hypothetical protein